MPDNPIISRQAFEETAARLGISGTGAHMDELFLQLQGVLAGNAALINIDVADTEPDMAFIPSPGISPLPQGES